MTRAPIAAKGNKNAVSDAGVAALMRSANPDVDVITMKRILLETADELGAPGDDNVYGHGFLDAYEAVSRVLELGWVSGVVTDAGTGQPIAGAAVDFGRLPAEFLHYFD